MLRITFKSAKSGKESYRTVPVNFTITPGATHVFREMRNGKWTTTTRAIRGTTGWAVANYMRAVHTRGGRIELLGTL